MLDTFIEILYLVYYLSICTYIDLSVRILNDGIAFFSSNLLAALLPESLLFLNGRLCTYIISIHYYAFNKRGEELYQINMFNQNNNYKQDYLNFKLFI